MRNFAPRPKPNSKTSANGCAGAIDIVIGTHKLLNPALAFKELDS